MPSSISLIWKEGSRFEGVSRAGVTGIDGDGRTGPSPVELLLESVGACAAVDVVEILRKGRQELRGLEVRVTAERREQAPRHLTRLDVEFRVRGAVERPKAERAARLAFEKYCSVFHSLRPDLELKYGVEVVEEPESPPAPGTRRAGTKSGRKRRSGDGHV